MVTVLVATQEVISTTSSLAAFSTISFYFGLSALPLWGAFDAYFCQELPAIGVLKY